jgi:hypothetical protein
VVQAGISGPVIIQTLVFGVLPFVFPLQPCGPLLLQPFFGFRFLSFVSFKQSGIFLFQVVIVFLHG